MIRVSDGHGVYSQREAGWLMITSVLRENGQHGSSETIQEVPYGIKTLDSDLRIF